MVDFGTRSGPDGWSEEQERLLSVIPHVTGTLSILGSAFIIYDVAMDRKKLSSTYHRLLLGMGVVDFISSFATTFSTIPMPADSGEYSYGNAATCTLQGFFVHFNIASPLYNLMLSIYFLLTVTFKWSKDDIKQKVEIWLHGIPFAWSFVTAMIVLLQNGFHNSNLWCWINSVPANCYGNDDIQCEYCPYCAAYYRMIFFFGPLWFAAFGTIVVMGMLVHSVRKTEKKAARWRPQSVMRLKIDEDKDNRDLLRMNKNDRKLPTIQSGDETSNHSRSCLSNHSRSVRMDCDDDKEKAARSTQDLKSSRDMMSKSLKSSREMMSASMRTPSRLGFRGSRLSSIDLEERRERRKASRLTRVVAGQAFRYCAVFWVTWLPGSANRILQLTRGYSYFWVMFFHVIFTPMQGLLNSIAYVDLRIRKWIRDRKVLRQKAKQRTKRRKERLGAENDEEEVSLPAVQTNSNPSGDSNENGDWFEISEEDF